MLARSRRAATDVLFFVLPDPPVPASDAVELGKVVQVVFSFHSLLHSSLHASPARPARSGSITPP